MGWVGWGVWEGRGGVFHSSCKGFKDKSDRIGCFGKIHHDNKSDKLLNFNQENYKLLRGGETGAKKRRQITFSAFLSVMFL